MQFLMTEYLHLNQQVLPFQKRDKTRQAIFSRIKKRSNKFFFHKGTSVNHSVVL